MNKKFLKAYTTLSSIETASDLRRNRLNINEFYACREMLQELARTGATVNTFLKDCADFFRRSGFDVTTTEIGYIINA